MSKYSVAGTAIDGALIDGSAAAVAPDEQLLALIVLSIARYQEVAGAEEARKALRYELSNLSGTVDTVFLRSR